MNKKVSLGAAVTFALIVAAAVFSLTMMFANEHVNRKLTDLQSRELEYSKFSEINRVVRQYYYGEIKESDLRDSTSEGFMKGIGDPYAKYYTAEEYAVIQQGDVELSASIGTAQRVNSEGYIEITDVFYGSPADVAKIKPGSLIVTLDDVAISADNAEQKMAELFGPEGSQITLTVRYDGEEQYHDIIRRVVNPPTVKWEMLEDSTVGYVHILSFDKDTSNQFNRALKDLEINGADRLIIDVRGTESHDDITTSATRMLDRLVPAGLMVSELDKEGNTKELAFSDSNALNWPAAVIVNSQTAGVPEIFAQVLSDFGAARVVGTATAGKGVSLDTKRLSDGSAIRFTTAVYQTPSGKSFDGTGVFPDYEVSAQVDDKDWEKMSKENDPQLLKALDIVNASS